MLHLADSVGFYATLDHYETVYPSNDEDDIESIWSGIVASMLVAGILSFVLHFIILELLNRKFHIVIICFIYYGTALAKMYFDKYKSYQTHYLIYVLWAFASTGTRMLVTVYINETTMGHKRGRLIALKTLFCYLVYTLDIGNRPIRPYSWLILAIATVVSILCLWLPETPVYLLRRGNMDAAKQSLRQLLGNTLEAEQEIEKLRNLLEATHSDTVNSIAAIKKFSNFRTLRYIGLAILLCLLEFLSGGVLAEMNILIQLDGMQKGESLIKMFAYLIIFTLGITTGLMMCEHLGHGKTLIASVVVCSLALFLNGIWFSVVDTYWHTNVISFLLAASHFFGYSFGISFLPTAITIDIFPPCLLNVLLAITGIISWPFYADDICGRMYHDNTLHIFLWPLCAGCALTVPFFYFFLPDTTDRAVGALLLTKPGVNLADTSNEHI